MRNKRFKYGFSLVIVFFAGTSRQWNSSGFKLLFPDKSIASSADDGDSTASAGFSTQGGYFAMPRKLVPAVRYSMLDPGNDLPDDVQKEYVAGINYYFRGGYDAVEKI